MINLPDITEAVRQIVNRAYIVRRTSSCLIRRAWARHTMLPARCAYQRSLP